jgi:uncharacterized protein
MTLPGGRPDESPADNVLDMIGSDPALTAVLREVRSRMAGAGHDAAHDETHLLRVAQWTVRLGGAALDARSAVAAALLHDVVNVAKNDPRRSRASELSAEVARELLPPLGFDPPAVDEIACAIRDHSFSRGATPASRLGRALQDADRLEALGATGVFRCIATGALMDAAFFHPTDPWATERPLDDGRYSVDHFFAKLFGLPATMQTDAGRVEAERRVSAMRALLRQRGEEIGRPLPDNG